MESIEIVAVCGCPYPMSPTVCRRAGHKADAGNHAKVLSPRRRGRGFGSRQSIMTLNLEVVVPSLANFSADIRH